VSKDAEFYDKTWSDKKYATEGVSQVLRRRQIIQFIRKYTPGVELALLELGCGKGFLTEAISKFGQATGIDFAAKTIEQNKQRSPHLEFVWGDITDPLLPQHLIQYDVVVSSEVIEHIEIAKRAQFLQNVDALLRPGGVVILTTPNKDVILGRKLPHESEAEFFDRFDNQPIDNIMSQEELLALLEPYFEFVDFASVQPLVKIRWLDLFWKGLFWFLDYKFVNNLTNALGLKGQYMVVISRKPTTG